MTRRLTTTAAAGALGLILALAGCSGDEPDSASEGSSDDPLAVLTPPTDPAPVPSVDPSADASIALRGEWADEELTYFVHFHEDGTFTEDIDGVPNVRSGTYEVEGDTVLLYGTDGETVEAEIDGDTLVFDRATVSKL